MKNAVKGTNKPAIPPPHIHLFDQMTESKARDSFDWSSTKVIASNVLMPFIHVCDPEVVKDMLLTKNTQTDRPYLTLGSVANVFGHSFLVLPTNDEWKVKRKSLAHSFFKDRLIIMLDNLKKYNMEAHQKWLD